MRVMVFTDEIICAHYDLKVDYKAHQFAICKDLYDHDGPSVVYWEGQRIVDMVWKFLEEWSARGLKDSALIRWVARFQADKHAAARDFWEEMRAGIDEAFQAGAGAIPEISAPYKAAKLDIMEKK